MKKVFGLLVVLAVVVAWSVPPAVQAQNYKPEYKLSTVVGKPFPPGVSGNPGGRPKGLARRVRELVGEDGEAIVQFLVETMHDSSVRTRDRLEAARLLADRGWGRPAQALEIELELANQRPGLNVNRLSSEDREAMISILERYVPNAAEMAAAGAIPVRTSSLETPSR